ncbi:MAG: YraN family protein [Chloroflexi bacterium]|nr:YraN family protein [Chloroflexota bacterium]
MDRRKEIGQKGEDRAARYLESIGYRIVGRNWRHALGELDIVAMDKQELVFVEVRTIESPHFGVPEESVGRFKQRQLAKLATAYVQGVKHAGDWRIDVVAIDGDGLRHIPNAVSLW